MVASREGNFDMFKHLEIRTAKKVGIVKGSTFDKGMNLISLAISSKNEALIKYILDRNYVLNLKQGYPLHVTAEKCMTKSLDNILAKGLDVNLKNEDGQTALHLAAQNQN